MFIMALKLIIAMIPSTTMTTTSSRSV